MQTLQTSQSRQQSDQADDLTCELQLPKCSRRAWNGGSFLLLGASAITFFMLFVVYARQNGDARTCSLTYDKESTISEAQMALWAGDAPWPLTHPKWNNDKRACTCDPDPDPKSESSVSKTPTWIAPVDIVGLYPNATFPPDFPRTAQGSKDHVKVCLEKAKLDQLWNGLDAEGVASGPKHCHSESPFQIYTGWDGDLYCQCNHPILNYGDSCQIYPECNQGQCQSQNGYTCCNRYAQCTLTENCPGAHTP